MIRLIQGAERHKYPIEIEAMHRLRAAVFHERLAWPVTVLDGWERDGFDELNPLYVLVVTEDGVVRGSARLLPTIGPNMLCDVFADLLPQGRQVRSPTIWESSRFSVLHDPADQLARQINPITGELLSGIVEVGVRSGLEFVVTVMDVSVERVLRRAGCPCERIGSPRRIGKSLAVAGLFEMTEGLLGGIRRASGLNGSRVCQDDAERLGLAA
jgi:N-acyl-L-homoserine lactone synthetase